ncbi:biotin-dependent carboxylase uncharacterized domain-containing protein [Natronincola peptidivorans]|uniref:Biotin-dependent carboxylase uncharacterized domain-containing protein n=1 Tax=Natronincola peptidivorans TaxID=426128 RepID=A0A1H9ZMB9_9FIRM|nr:biotin-dependent carboxyltransferase family protein [Natronincola peptidivorans]SES82789.1 biotin-dependent carboxylase uncharacterized domain-containing protein [Natronincola peptidivorans]
MGQIKIIKPGLLTTVQDLGRYGYQQYGVTVSGVMDHVSARLANALVENDEGEGLLEITMQGPEIEFLEDMVIAITGGDLQPWLNGQPIAMARSMLVQKGDKLTFKGMKSGCRSYIAFSGGIDVPVLMGSKSTFTRGKIGGYEGRALKAGDILKVGEPKEPFSSLVDREIYENLYEYNAVVELRVVLGPQEEAFTEAGRRTFFSNEYTVTNECDRMGYRLEGETIEHKDGGDIISDGISMGAIQIPSHGKPIIMMADRQTTGGYTKIGNVITVDLPKAAQVKPGDKIVFKEITLEEAHQLLKGLEDKITILKQQCSRKYGKQEKEVKRTRKFHLKINGKPYNVVVEELK